MGIRRVASSSPRLILVMRVKISLLESASGANKEKATQAAHTSSVVSRKGPPLPPQGLELGTPLHLDEDEHEIQLHTLTHRSPIHLRGLLANKFIGVQ
eukprot:1156433-Pelagomonas_calceolata.AAC.1